MSVRAVAFAPGLQNTDYQGISDQPGFQHAAGEHDEQYVLRNARTGRPLVNVAYRLVSPSGATVQGVTDGAGRTQRIKTSAVQKIKVEIKEIE
jgi:uncharacterized protein (DUF2345 family)